MRERRTSGYAAPDFDATPPETDAGTPRLRGVIHEVAFFVALVAGAALVIVAAPDARPAAGVYAASLCSLFGVSALYHRRPWRAGPRRWIRRLDHSMIFVLIAGTYTPVTVLVFSPRTGLLWLASVWAAAVAGIVFNLAWLDAPRWLSVLLYAALGWVGVATVPAVVSAAGAGVVALIFGGGAAYSLGALAYAFKRPNPVPGVFGFHEVFHAGTVVAAGLHFAAVAALVLPH